MTERLSAAVQAHRDLVERVKAAYPQEDEATLRDTIEGLTDLDAAVLAVLREALWFEDQAEAAQRRVEQIRGRKAYFEAQAEKLRAAALRAMQDASIPKVWGADLSANVSRGVAKVIVFDESQIPDHYIRVKREPDKAAIREQLKHGGEVPGCGLSNAPEILRVRRD